MNISSVIYTNERTSVAITMDDGVIWNDDASLPPDNEVRRLLADWLADGGVIEPYVAPEAPLPELTQRQLRLWLVRNGYTIAQVEAILDGLPEPVRSEALIEWEFASKFEPSHSTLLAVAAALEIADLPQAIREAALI